MKKKKSSKKKPDFFKKVKYIGYKMAIGGSAKDGMNFREFINYARTYLCLENKVLFKDPIWDEYRDEEILVEYFAHLFRNDEERREAFEKELGVKGNVYDDFLTWANDGIKVENDKIEEVAEKLEDNVSFSPDSLGD